MNLLRLMGTRLKIASLLMFFIGAHLIIPEIADARGTFSTLTANVFSATDGLTAPKDTSPRLKNISPRDELNSTFVPQNYSGPDSTHGSGTR